MSTNVFFTDEKQKTKIMTTRKTGGLLYPYKGLLQAMCTDSLTGPLKGFSNSLVGILSII